MSAVHFLERSKEMSYKVSICKRQVNWREALLGGMDFQKEMGFLLQVAQKFQLKVASCHGFQRKHTHPWTSRLGGEARQVNLKRYTPPARTSVGG